MFKFVVLASLLALASGNKIGLGSFAKPDSSLSPKVISGEPAALGEFPYQVSLHRTGLLVSAHYCGGSIISRNTVLTAGHCVTEVNIGVGQRVEILAGFISQANPGTTQQLRRVKTTIVHPDFPGQVAPYDLALHVLESAFTINENVQIIPLAQPSVDADASDSGVSTLSGWGSTSTTQVPTLPDHLQKVDLPLITFEECLAAVDGLETPLDETMICTGPLTGGYGACSGDSGGPLVQNGTLIGVVSWGFIPCGGVGVPSVFTRVTSHLDWINENTVQ